VWRVPSVGARQTQVPTQALREACPAQPYLELFVEHDDRIVVFDLEFQHPHVVHEIGAAPTTCRPDGTWCDLWGVGGWTEFNVVIKTTGVTTNTWCTDNCPGLRDDILRRGVSFLEAWRKFIEVITHWRPPAPHRTWLKAHNGIAADMRNLIAHALRAGVEDPIGALERAGVAGIIDPMRFVAAYGLTTMQTEKPGKGGNAGSTVHTGCVGNDELFFRATGKRIAETRGLTAHRATHDAKVERTWLQRLPELNATMFGPARKACGIALAQYRSYHEQYDRHAALLERLG
jgi:hypothetical protein